MKTIVQLLIAACFGVIAVVLNFMWMSRESNYPLYVAADTRIAYGETILPDKLKSVPVKGDETANNQSLVPWKNRHLFENRLATREFQPGDLFFQRDLVEETQATQWDYLGPFRLVGVGGSPAAGVEQLIGQEYATTGSVLTLAVSAENRAETELLLRYLAAMRGEYLHGESEQEKRLLRIMAIQSTDLQLAPSPPGGIGATGASPIKSPLEGADRLIYVDIDGVPNAPPFLRIGETILFVTPYGKQKFLASPEVPREPAVVTTPAAP
ncbi:hypothetical protein [Lignipirellula cremea]|uniref:Uncharacterized protein n=1 Tax=Lignipirellula cremea TaxID=2528010 RepID=A0A518E0T0_9BACT|nr:hypothetical protein [Lignipirellula cremea]QDU97687.1 hypothetical protein Pla8534_55400 [Lignipirellula cremea]